jgi:hypothetical protein
MVVNPLPCGRVEEEKVAGMILAGFPSGRKWSSKSFLRYIQILRLSNRVNPKELSVLNHFFIRRIIVGVNLLLEDHIVILKLKP